MIRGLLSVLVLAAVAAAAPSDCHALRRRGQARQAQSCYRQLTASQDPYLRAEGYWGLKMHRDANDQFRLAVKIDAKNPLYKTRWGRLLLERFNKKEAADLFSEALAIDKEHAGALLGLAVVASEGFDRMAVEYAEKAIQADAKLYEARELLANLALEDMDPARAVREADAALAISGEALDAMAVRAAVEALADRAPDEWLSRVFKTNASYGEAHAIVAHHLVLNRRYEEGIEHYRRAIQLDPENWSARSNLGINLMRLGQEEEARRQLEQCYGAGYQDYPTVNTLRLLDSYKNFLVFKTPTTILKLHRKEAELLRPYLESELQRAIAVYEQKYKFKLNRPVQLEAYPDHEDFAVRTLGMPGLGALGVTFGDVVAMDSPSGRKPGTFHWASTLWHELSHVFVLSATRHRVPRWFTEGMAVHEETAISPDCGDRITPDILLAIKDKKLLPVSRLDRGFIRPAYPGQVVVSYFQAGRICDFIKEKWGYERLLGMMREFAALKTTPEAVRSQLGLEAADFDSQFLAWLDQQTGKAVGGFEEWRAGMRKLADAAKASDHDHVLRDAPALRDLYPEYVEHGSAYQYIAEAHLAKSDRKSAAAELERYARLGGRDLALLKKLAGLQEELGDKPSAARTLNRITWVYLHDEEQHRRLGALHLDSGDWRGAVREFQAVVDLKPIDTAQAHFNLARAYDAGRQRDKAEEHLLLALEAAPGFRPAQKLLLQLHGSGKEKH